MSGKRISKEDKQALLDLVREEIEEHLDYVSSCLNLSKEEILSNPKKVNFFQIDGLPLLSRNKTLESLLGIRNNLNKYLTALDPNLKNYRRRALLSQSPKAEERKIIKEIVLDEIDLHKRGKIDHFSTANEIKETFGVSETTISDVINKLDPELRDYRSKKLSIWCGTQHRLLSNAKITEIEKFVEDEMVKVNADPDYQILTNADLGFLYDVDSETIARTLSLHSNLEKPLLEKRAVIINSQNRSRNGKKTGQILKEEGYDFSSMGRKGGNSTYQHQKGVHSMTSDEKRKLGLLSWSLGLGVHSMSTEQRRKIGLENYRKRLGIHGESSESRRLRGIEFGRKMYDERRGCFGIDPATGERWCVIGAKNGSKKGGLAGAKALRKMRKIQYDGVYFDSKEEAVVAKLLETYIEGFKINPGLNYQIQVNGLWIDFMLDDNTYFDYHPIKLLAKKSQDGKNQKGDIPTWEGYLDFCRVRDSLNKEDKRIFKRNYAAMLAYNYTSRRRFLISEENEFIFVAHYVQDQCIKDFYENVIKRFGREDIPNLRDFKSEFRFLLKSA